mmetsp:Transcript_1166/g.1597  ORF Transcript_1166/g.1597 Transcript_1166/m.1597 type:complete len:127 (-) Transcript_1166:56-436(-)
MTLTTTVHNTVIQAKVMIVIQMHCQMVQLTHVKACWKDEIDFPMSTFVAYFGNCKDEKSIQHLFAVYQWIINCSRNFQKKELHQACRANKLADYINKQYKGIPEDSLVVYYKWFRNHQRVVKNFNT